MSHKEERPRPPPQSSNAYKNNYLPPPPRSHNFFNNGTWNPPPLFPTPWTHPSPQSQWFGFHQQRYFAPPQLPPPLPPTPLMQASRFRTPSPPPTRRRISNRSSRRSPILPTGPHRGYHFSSWNNNNSQRSPHSNNRDRHHEPYRVAPPKASPASSTGAHYSAPSNFKSHLQKRHIPPPSSATRQNGKNVKPPAIHRGPIRKKLSSTLDKRSWPVVPLPDEWELNNSMITLQDEPTLSRNIIPVITIKETESNPVPVITIKDKGSKKLTDAVAHQRKIKIPAKEPAKALQRKKINSFPVPVIANNAKGSSPVQLPVVAKEKRNPALVPVVAVQEKSRSKIPFPIISNNNAVSSTKTEEIVSAEITKVKSVKDESHLNVTMFNTTPITVRLPITQKNPNGISFNAMSILPSKPPLGSSSYNFSPSVLDKSRWLDTPLPNYKPSPSKVPLVEKLKEKIRKTQPPPKTLPQDKKEHSLPTNDGNYNYEPKDAPNIPKDAIEVIIAGHSSNEEYLDNCNAPTFIAQGFRYIDGVGHIVCFHKRTETEPELMDI